MTLFEFRTAKVMQLTDRKLLTLRVHAQRGLHAGLGLCVHVCVCVCVCLSVFLSTAIVALQTMGRPMSDTSSFRTTGV